MQSNQNQKLKKGSLLRQDAFLRYIMHDQDPIDPRQINDLYCYVTSHQANSAWPSLRGYAQWVLAMVAAAAIEENGEFCVQQWAR